MKKKGQRTFNNENVHRIKMLGLTLYPLYSPLFILLINSCGLKAVFQADLMNGIITAVN